MIEKMKFLSISGPKGDIDRVAELYLSKYEIQLENAMTELKAVRELTPYSDSNPYKDMLNRADRLITLLPDTDSKPPLVPLTAEEAAQIIDRADKAICGMNQEADRHQQTLKELKASYEMILPFQGLNHNISSILHFQHIRFRFGRIPKEYMQKMERYIMSSLDTVFCECRRDENYIWGVYFVPAAKCDGVDAVYLSMHFEHIEIPDSYEGTPEQAAAELKARIDSAQEKLDGQKQEISDYLESSRRDLVSARERLLSFSTNFDVRRYAACTGEESRPFYILCGWMTESDAEAFRREVKKDPQVNCIVDDTHDRVTSKPPTKLKNPKLIRPFEMYTRMYGLPSYGEFDPTLLVAITYSFFFGFMFGDVGQGLLLLIGGFLLYHYKKLNLAGIIACCGAFSTLFGFLFGSVFGFEDVLEPLWLRPVDAMTQLPFIGNLNTVFVVTVAIGMGVILLTMVLNIINMLRARQRGEAWFDTNGVAGFVFYGALVGTIVLFMTGNPVPAAAVLVIMFVVPLLIIACKEPLTALIEKKPELMPKKKVMFVVQAVFELIEVLLSYFSNTLSFVRVGAFAVSHAAMMQVVMMLAGAEEGGSLNLVVVVFGNLFVCGMEGLIVGIQVLRLEYYELFSRFYHGGGREFTPYRKRDIHSSGSDALRISGRELVSGGQKNAAGK